MASAQFDSKAYKDELKENLDDFRQKTEKDLLLLSTIKQTKEDLESKRAQFHRRLLDSLLAQRCVRHLYSQVHF